MRITTRRMFDIYDMMTKFKGYAGLTHLFLCVCVNAYDVTSRFMMRAGPLLQSVCVSGIISEFKRNTRMAHLLCMCVLMCTLTATFVVK